MAALFAVSQSKVQQWRRCRRMYHNQHILGLKKRAPPRPLKFGTIVHRMAEADATGADPLKVLDQIAVKDEKLFESEREMYGEIISDASYIWRAYKKFWKKQPLQFVPIKHKEGKKVVTRKAEHPFEVEVTSEIVCKGKMDGVVRYGTLNWLLEHKTHASFPNDDHRWRNLQSAVYIRIVDMLGWPKVTGTLWDYIRSKSPTRPKLLQSGKLSEASIDSLPEVILDTKKQAIAEGHKLVSLQPLTTLLEEQERNLQTWFQRIRTPVNKDVVRTLFQEFVDTGREMAAYYDKNPNKPPPRTIDLHCSWCSYEAVCRAEIQGNDVDHVIENQYVVVDFSAYGEGEEEAA